MFAYCNNTPVMYADYDGEDIEITIYTQEFEFVVSGGTVTVKYSLVRRIEENEAACVRFEPDGIEYGLSGPASIIISDKIDSIEFDLSVTLASYEAEYGSISVALSLQGIGLTVTNELGDGIFEEITYRYKPDARNNLSRIRSTVTRQNVFRAAVGTGIAVATTAALPRIGRAIYNFVSKLMWAQPDDGTPSMEAGVTS